LGGELEAALEDLDASARRGSVEGARTARRLRAGAGLPAAGSGPKGLGSALSLGKGARGRAASASAGSGGAAASIAAALSGASYASSSAASRPARQAPPPSQLVVKLRLESEGGPTAPPRALALPLSVSYSELLAACCAAFPAAGPLALRFADLEGDLVTITSRRDINFALQTAMQRFSRELEEAARGGSGSGARALPPGALPPLALSAFRVDASPLPPADELGSEAPPAPPMDDVVEIDEWMLDMSSEFRARLGLAEGECVDVQAAGLERCCEVLEGIVADERCAPMLVAAAAKFQSAAALAMFNWGNVHVSAGRKRHDAAVTAAALRAKGEHGPHGIPVAAMEAAIEAVTAESLEEFDAHFADAQLRWANASEVKPDFLDPAISWGQQLFERAKILALRAKELPPRASPAQVDAAFAAAAARFETLLGELPADDSSEDAQLQRNNLQILTGNVLFEHSQVTFRRGDAEAVWRLQARSAVEHFSAAHCASSDIERALRGHPSGAFPNGKLDCDQPPAAIGGVE